VPQLLSYFDLKSDRRADRLVVSVVGAVCWVCRFAAVRRYQLASVPTLTRLWSRMPCPVQIRAPSVPSMRVRSQRYPRLRPWSTCSYGFDLNGGLGVQASAVARIANCR